MLSLSLVCLVAWVGSARGAHPKGHPARAHQSINRAGSDIQAQRLWCKALQGRNTKKKSEETACPLNIPSLSLSGPTATVILSRHTQSRYVFQHLEGCGRRIALHPPKGPCSTNNLFSS